MIYWSENFPTWVASTRNKGSTSQPMHTPPSRPILTWSSIAVAFVAYVLPTFGTWWWIEADAAEQNTRRGWACGNPVIGLVLLAGLVAIALSLLALILRGFATRRWRGRRLWPALAEIAVFALPLLGGLAVEAYLYWLLHGGGD